MGQATVDLPDPLDPAAASTEAPAAPAASADDLLAQLAGEEIDRLLAEADAERPTLADRAAAAKFASTTSGDSAPAAPLAPPAPPAPNAQPAPTSVALPAATGNQAAGIPTELDALFEQIDAGDRPPAPPATATSAAEPATKREMTADEIAAAILASPPATEPRTEPAAADAPAIEASAAQVADSEIEAAASASTSDVASAAVTIAEMATGAAEATALLDDEVAAPAPGSEFLLEDGDYSPPTLLVRMLELLNAPFAALPESFREALGKIAILTLFNSLAVLTYVLLFRRHH
jgi:hypothetical protein